MPQRNLKIVYRPVAELAPYANNSRLHSAEQVAQLVASMGEWGFTNPVLIDEHGAIIAGHGRTMAAQQIGMLEVPTITLAGLTDAQKRAYVIADNKLSLNAEWDSDLLLSELQALAEMDFDLSLTGFSDAEIDAMNPGDVDALDQMPALPDGDREPFQQKAFTLHDEQVAVVDNALALARTDPLVDTGLNENSNGNALALICAGWLKARSRG